MTRGASDTKVGVCWLKYQAPREAGEMKRGVSPHAPAVEQWQWVRLHLANPELNYRVPNHTPHVYPARNRIYVRRSDAPTLMKDQGRGEEATWYPSPSSCDSSVSGSGASKRS